MKVAVIGLGLVGLRVARELAGSDQVGRVLLQSGDRARQRSIKDALGDKVVIDGSRAIQADVTVIAAPDEFHLELAESALASGSSVVSTAESPETVLALLALDERASGLGKSVIVGAGFSPGLSMILARHARALFDDASEIHTAVYGAGGASCARRKAAAAFENATEWRGGEWQEAPARSGREIQWFADPIGAFECHKGGLAEPILLHRMFPEAERLTARMGATPRAEWRAMLSGVVRTKPDADEIGAIRVELRGQTNGVSDTVVYGAVDRLSVGTAAVAASAAVFCEPESGVTGLERVSGAFGVAELIEPVVLLAELARRGVKAGVFEGVQ